MERNMLLSTMNFPMSWLIGVCSALFCFSLLLAGPGAAQTFFTEAPDEAIVWTPFTDPARSSAFRDYDNDGRPDVFMTEFHTSRIALLHNEGDGRFTDRTSTIQADIPSQWKGGGFGDYDSDGDLDLFIGMGNTTDNPDRNMLLRNDTGVFTEVTQEAGLADVELPAYSGGFK